MAKEYFKINKDTMTVEDYKALYDAVVHMSCDIESEQPRPWEAAADEDTLMIYSYIEAMINCITDVPNSQLDYAVKHKGIKLPEID